MGVLPDRSKKIVPTVYHELMTDPASPIINFYPRDFELDMNGKKMEWEAVVKIPFMDEKRLLEAMAPKDKLLTEEQAARNDFGVTLKFGYSSELDFTYPSSLIGIFPDIAHCHCVVNIFELPTMEGLELYIGLADGVQLGSAALAGFPSLKTLPHVGALGFHGVNVFQQDSRNESMVVTLIDPETRTKVEAAKTKIGKKLHVGYPFLQEAKVTRVSDELFDYIMPDSANGQVVSVPHGPQDIDQWRKKAERIESTYSKRLAMIIGPVESLVHVDPLKGLRKTDEGATVKEFGPIPGLETDYASQIVVEEVISEDQRFLEKAAVPIEEEFPEGTRAFFLGEFNYGRPLEIVRHVNNKAEAWVSIAKAKEPDFGREAARNAERITPYTPSYAVARMLSLNPLVLSKITSSFSVMMDGLRLNLGLNLKFEAKKLKVLGYSRRAASGWEFSEKAIALVQQYMVNFPDFIAGIQRKPQGDTYTPTDFYPEETSRAKMKEISAWLKTVESKSFEKVPLDAEQMDSEVVKQVELAADRLTQKGIEVEGKKIKGVPRNALLKPSDAEHRLGNQHFSLGDRVVYAADSGRVPIATHGTVVGVTRTSRTTLLDIVFDVTFMSGTTLGERCSPFRGSTVPLSSVLNITDRQLVAGSKAAAVHRPQPTAQPLTVSGYGAPVGPGGKGQYVEARAPAPLRGSFRGAVAGQLNGGRHGIAHRGRGRAGGVMSVGNHSGPHQQSLPNRGRGQAPTPRGRGGNVQGSNGQQQQSQVNGDSHDGVQAFLRTYSNVPPPPSLDARPRGGGRGGARGDGARGDNFRGRGMRRGGIVAVNQHS